MRCYLSVEPMECHFSTVQKRRKVLLRECRHFAIGVSRSYIVRRCKPVRGCQLGPGLATDAPIRSMASEVRRTGDSVDSVESQDERDTRLCTPFQYARRIGKSLTSWTTDVVQREFMTAVLVLIQHRLLPRLLVEDGSEQLFSAAERCWNTRSVLKIVPISLSYRCERGIALFENQSASSLFTHSAEANARTIRREHLPAYPVGGIREEAPVLPLDRVVCCLRYALSG